jgi:N-acetylglucosaminyl-diphospho-decaprenol L-rhamnosyltransferase
LSFGDQANLSDTSDATRPDATIIVVNYNTAHLLDRMFEAIEASRGNLSIQLIVVDNASHDGSVRLVRERRPDVELIENKANVGFGRANNQALLKARGRYLLLLNTDAFVAPDTLHKTIDFMDSHAEYGVLGVKLVRDDGTLHRSYFDFPTPWNVSARLNKLCMWLDGQFFPRPHIFNEHCRGDDAVRQCDWVPGCYYLVRREVIDEVGLFDPRFFLYYEEIDHCRRVHQARWSVVYYPHTQVLHIGGASAASDGEISESMVESKLLYFRKHYGLIGVLTGVLLSTLSNTARACNVLLRGRDAAKAAVVAQYICTHLRLLIATRLARRPTR